MIRLLLFVVALSASLADEVAQESAGPEPVMFINNKHAEHRLSHDWDGHHRDRYRDDHHDLDRHRDGHHDLDRHRDGHYDLDRHRDGHNDHDRHRNDHRDRHHDDDGDWLKRRLSDDHWWERRDERHDHDLPEGPVILRSIRPHETGHKPDIARQNKIIADVYSPDYAEPTWVLDYRYLKTGGRDYTRGPGGQILILPRGIHTNEPKEFKNYDELIEHLRLKNLAERNKPQYFMPLGEGAYHEEREHKGHGHDRRDWWRHQ